MSPLKKTVRYCETEEGKKEPCKEGYAEGLADGNWLQCESMNKSRCRNLVTTEEYDEKNDKPNFKNMP